MDYKICKLLSIPSEEIDFMKMSLSQLKKVQE